MPNTVHEPAKEVAQAVLDRRIHVAVAAIRNKNNQVLLSKRHPDSHQGGLWEFPGGKVEHGEAVEQALSRELREELCISVIEARSLIRIPFDYPDRKVLLDVWLVTDYTGEPAGAEGQDIAWVDLTELSQYSMPPANSPIVYALKLPDIYLITPEPGLTHAEWHKFLSELEKSVENNIELVQFRAKSLGHSKYIELANDVLSVCHSLDCKVMFNIGDQYKDLPDADGIHMSSEMLMRQEKRMIGRDKLLAASCHTLYELEHANAIGCDFAVLSPLLETKSHPDTISLGWDEFERMCDNSRIPVYALGGMTEDYLYQAWHSGAQGVSGISAFWKN